MEALTVGFLDNEYASGSCIGKQETRVQQSVLSLVGKEQLRGQILTLTTRVEAGSNTFTVILRVVGGDEKGSLKSETVKYGH
jgi:hypothetical protein